MVHGRHLSDCPGARGQLFSIFSGNGDQPGDDRRLDRRHRHSAGGRIRRRSVWRQPGRTYPRGFGVSDDYYPYFAYTNALRRSGRARVQDCGAPGYLRSLIPAYSSLPTEMIDTRSSALQHCLDGVFLVHTISRAVSGPLTYLRTEKCLASDFDRRFRQLAGVIE